MRRADRRWGRQTGVCGRNLGRMERTKTPDGMSWLIKVGAVQEKGKEILGFFGGNNVVEIPL